MKVFSACALAALLVWLFDVEATCYFLRTKYNYPINEPNLCYKYGSPYIIAYVHSAPSHFVQRQAIRSTWANPKYFKQFGITTFFQLGHPNATESADEKVTKRIDNESRIYGDLIMADFVEAYRNLTFKNVAGMRWIEIYCMENQPDAQKQPRYVLKCDDDAFIDTFRLVRLIRDLERINFNVNTNDNKRLEPPALQKTFFGYTRTCDGPDRDRHSRYYVSVQEFAGTVYPRK